MASTDPIREHQRAKGTFSHLREIVNDSIDLYDDLYTLFNDLVLEKHKLPSVLSEEEIKIVLPIIRDWEAITAKGSHWYLNIRGLIARGGFCLQVESLIRIEREFGKDFHEGTLTLDQINKLLALLKNIEMFKDKGFLGKMIDKVLDVLEKNEAVIRDSEEYFEFNEDDAKTLKEEIKEWRGEWLSFLVHFRARLFEMAVCMLDSEARRKRLFPSEEPENGVDILQAYCRDGDVKQELDKLNCYGNLSEKLWYWHEQFSYGVNVSKAIDHLLGDGVRRVCYLRQKFAAQVCLTEGVCLGDTDFWTKNFDEKDFSRSIVSQDFRLHEDLHQQEVTDTLMKAQSSSGGLFLDPRHYEEVDNINFTEFDRDGKILAEKLFECMFAKKQQESSSKKVIFFRILCFDKDFSNGHSLGFCFDYQTDCCAFRDSNGGVFVADDHHSLKEFFIQYYQLTEYLAEYREVQIFLDRGVDFVPKHHKDIEARRKMYAFFGSASNSGLLSRIIFERVVSNYHSLSAPTVSDDLFLCFKYATHSEILYCHRQAEYLDYFRKTLELANQCLARNPIEPNFIVAYVKLMVALRFLQRDEISIKQEGNSVAHEAITLIIQFHHTKGDLLSELLDMSIEDSKAIFVELNTHNFLEAKSFKHFDITVRDFLDRTGAAIANEFVHMVDKNIQVNRGAESELVLAELDRIFALVKPVVFSRNAALSDRQDNRAEEEALVERISPEMS